MEAKMSVVVSDDAGSVVAPDDAGPQISVPNTGLFTWTGSEEHPDSNVGLVLVTGMMILLALVLAVVVFSGMITRFSPGSFLSRCFLARSSWYSGVW